MERQCQDRRPRNSRLLTLSSRSPNTAALERTVLSMKFNMYVTNSKGMITRSIFLSTLRAAAVEGP